MKQFVWPYYHGDCIMLHIVSPLHLEIFAYHKTKLKTQHRLNRADFLHMALPFLNFLLPTLSVLKYFEYASCVLLGTLGSLQLISSAELICFPKSCSL